MSHSAQTHGKMQKLSKRLHTHYYMKLGSDDRRVAIVENDGHSGSPPSEECRESGILKRILEREKLYTHR